jgi:two-component SAPR family response regulator
MRTEIGTDLAPCERSEHDRVDREARAALGADGFAAAWDRGRQQSLDDVLADDAPAPTSTRRPRSERRRPTARAEPAAGSVLRLTLLGRASVRLDERALSMADWGYAKPRELFFLLATSAGQTKAAVGVALWPELTDERLRNAFHTALRDLRRALGDPGWIVFNDGQYRLDRSREHWSDLEEFEKSLAAARRAASATETLSHLQWAIGHYAGELLPDVRSEWVQERRAALAHTFEGALAAAGRLLGNAGRWPEAVEVHRRAVTADPLSEPAGRALMQSLVRAGDPAEAVRVYRQLADRLQQELDTEPAAQTRALVEQLTRGPSPPRPT